MDKLKNFRQGLENFTYECENLTGKDLKVLLDLYGNISILIDKSMSDYSIEIAYPAQSLQSRIHKELKVRFNKS